MIPKKKILLVDDEPDAIEFVRAILSDLAEFNIISANDGNTGFELAKAAMPDLIILDHMMPGKMGFDVFNDLRTDKQTEKIPVVMITGVSEATGLKFDRETMGDFYGKEPEGFIDKPVDPTKLQETVRAVLNI